MADPKNYYYIRLKENFFDSDSLILMESMPDGILYSNILLKMYLKSLKHNGKLMLNDCIPYNSNMIATITRHQIGTVEKALTVFKDLGLIDVLNDNTIYMSDIELLIGKSSTEADRKRLARSKLIDGEELKGQMSDKPLPKIELELEKDTELEEDIENKSISIKEYVTILKNILKKYYVGSVAKRFISNKVEKRLITALKKDSFDDIKKGYENYLKERKANNTELEFVKGCHSFIIDRMYNDYLEDVDYTITDKPKQTSNGKKVIGNSDNWYKPDKNDNQELSKEEKERMQSILDNLTED